MADFLTKEDLEKFHKDGYVIIENFLSEEEVSALKNEYKSLVEEMDPKEEKATFATNPKDKGNFKSHEEDDYFLESGDKIRFFFEPKAFDEKGDFICEKHQCINKVGHALHWLNPTFKRITLSEKVKKLVKSLNMADPVILHSMYINKPPKIGSEVVPHQDATYLYCEPDDNVIGLWIPLEDADTENACLWFIPQSHNYPVERRMIREETDGRVKLTYIGNNPEYDNNLFVPAIVRRGDLVIIHGKVVHKSEANTSDRPRPIYTFHVLDKKNAHFSRLNWIQETEEFTFTSILRDTN